MEVISSTPRCTVCNTNTNFAFTAPCDYRKPRDSGAYDVYWCSGCDFGMIWQRPDKASVASFYDLDRYYTHPSEDDAQTLRIDRRPFLDRLRTHLAWRLDKSEDLSPFDATGFLSETTDLSLLEIGCGDGANMSQFVGNGFHAIGIEPDPKARAAAVQNGLTVYDGTAEDLPDQISDAQFHVVLMSHVLEHCLDANTAIANVKRALKPGGIFIVETPNCAALGFKKQKAEWPWSDIPRHLNFFTPTSLRTLLAKHGLEVVTEKYRGYCRQFADSWLATEEEVWGSFHGQSDMKSPKPNFKVRAWMLLIRSLMASKPKKYDSVRLIARNV